MRAVFENQQVLLQDIVIVLNDDRAHHLNVVRVKIGEDILVLDGNGTKAIAEVISISKKEIQLKIKTIEKKVKTLKSVLFISVPKKDAFEDILKIATECGFSEIVPLSTKYSQYEYEVSDRFNKIIESAMVQSNNLYRPKIHPQMLLKDLLNTSFDLEKSFLFTSFGDEKLAEKSSTFKSFGIFIGPEAGFSAEEEASILASKFKPIGIHLPIPIMRAPTAVAVSVGYILGKHEN